MQALEIRDLRLITRLDQRFISLDDQFRRTAAENGLLAKEIRLRLLGESRLEHAAPRAADRVCVSERPGCGAPCGILCNRQQARHALAGLVLAAYQITGALRSDQHDVERRVRLHAAVMDAEAMREKERRPRRGGRAPLPR